MSDETNEIPGTVVECIQQVRAARAELEALISTQSEAALTVPGPEEWAIKDHLSHLEVWSLAMQDTLNGISRYPRLGVADYAALHDLGYDTINAGIFERNRDRSLADVLAGFRASHQAMIDRLDGMSDADLARPYASYVPEVRPDADEAIVNWIAGNTWEHDTEHREWIKQQFGL